MEKSHEQPSKADNYAWFMLKYTLDVQVGFLMNVMLIKNGQTHLNNLSAVVEDLFKCVWPFCGVGA